MVIYGKGNGLLCGLLNFKSQKSFLLWIQAATKGIISKRFTYRAFASEAELVGMFLANRTLLPWSLYVKS